MKSTTGGARAMALGGFVTLVAAVAPAADLTSQATARRDVSLTIYNTDLSLVREQRTIPTQSGVFRLRYEDVTAGIEPAAVHLQEPADEAARYYNASVLLSAPMVALAANSPFLFGRELWQETRVPL